LATSQLPSFKTNLFPIFLSVLQVSHTFVILLNGSFLSHERLAAKKGYVKSDIIVVGPTTSTALTSPDSLDEGLPHSQGLSHCKGL
jgi:hypothetical protein